MEELFQTFPNIVYIFPISFLVIAFLVASIQVYMDYRESKIRKRTTELIVDDSIHYVERVINNKFITSCGKEIDVRSGVKNVIQFIPKVTCQKCLRKIT